MFLWIQIPSKPGFSYVQPDIYITFILRDKLTKKHRSFHRYEKLFSKWEKLILLNECISGDGQEILVALFFLLNLKVKKLNLFIRLFIYEERRIEGKTTLYICLHINCVLTSHLFFPLFQASHDSISVFFAPDVFHSSVKGVMSLRKGQALWSPAPRSALHVWPAIAAISYCGCRKIQGRWRCYKLGGNPVCGWFLSPCFIGYFPWLGRQTV